MAVDCLSSVIMKKHSSEIPPNYLCIDCAEKLGGIWLEKWYEATWHEGRCDYCQQVKSITNRKAWLWPKKADK